MELRQLRYFVEVARAGTYGAAAERLHVAQPGVWKQVRALETELGLVLFERHGRRVRLTSDGAILLAQADAALAGTLRVRDLAADLRAGVSGTVVVGCVSSHIAGFLAGLVAAHQREHPNVRVRLEEFDRTTHPHDPFDALRAGAVDVVTTSSPGSGFDEFPIYDVHVVAILASRHPWRGRSTIHVRDLAGRPLLTPPAGYLSRSLLERACARAGVELTIAMESSSPVALLALARARLGVLVIASDAVPPPTRPHPVIVDDSGPLAKTVSMITPRSPRPAVAEFADHARRIASPPAG